MKENFENKEPSPYQELYNLIEIKIGVDDTLAALKKRFQERGIITFIMDHNLKFYLSDCQSHYEICQQNGLEGVITYGYFYKNSRGEEQFSLILYPSYEFPSYAFKKYLPTLGEEAIKNMIKNKMRSLLTD